MQLRTIIKDYREKHGLSQRQFALRCNVSNGYISMLEEGRNPKTNEPIVPSLSTLKKLASAMSMTLNDLMLRADDMKVSLTDEIEKAPTTDNGNERLGEFMELFAKLTEEQQTLIISQIKGILSNQ